MGIAKGEAFRIGGDLKQGAAAEPTAVPKMRDVILVQIDSSLFSNGVAPLLDKHYSQRIVCFPLNIVTSATLQTTKALRTPICRPLTT